VPNGRIRKDDESSKILSGDSTVDGAMETTSGKGEDMNATTNSAKSTLHREGSPSDMKTSIAKQKSPPVLSSGNKAKRGNLTTESNNQGNVEMIPGKGKDMKATTNPPKSTLHGEGSISEMKTPMANHKSPQALSPGIQAKRGSSNTMSNNKGTVRTTSGKGKDLNATTNSSKSTLHPEGSSSEMKMSMAKHKSPAAPSSGNQAKRGSLTTASNNKGAVGTASGKGKDMNATTNPSKSTLHGEGSISEMKTSMANHKTPLVLSSGNQAKRSSSNNMSNNKGAVGTTSGKGEDINATTNSSKSILHPYGST
jgi:hypothetical protein